LEKSMSRLSPMSAFTYLPPASSGPRRQALCFTWAFTERTVFPNRAQTGISNMFG